MTIADDRAAATVRPELTRVSPGDVAFDNLLLAAAPRFETQIEGRPVAVALVPERELRPGLAVAGTFDEAALSFVIPRTALSVLVPGMAADVVLETLPDDLAMALASVALSNLLSDLGQALDGTFACTGPRLAEPPGGALVSLQAEAGAVLASIALQHAAQDALRERLQAMPSVSRWSGADDAAVRVQAEFARVEFSIEELRSLRRGDVALLPPGCDPSAVVVRSAASGRALATGQCDGGTVTVATVMGERMQDDDFDDQADDSLADFGDGDDEQTEAPASALDVEALPVELSFGLGTQNVTVAQLRALAPGFTFVLDGPGAGEVVIAAGGQEIGRGELVQIEDRLGVRIARLRDRDAD